MISSLITAWNRYRRQMIWLCLLFVPLFLGFYMLSSLFLEDLASMLGSYGRLFQKSVGEAFLARLTIAAVCGLLVCLFALIGTVLCRRSAKGIGWTLVGFGLFVLGGALARWALLPNAIRMLLSILSDQFEPRIALYGYVLFCGTFLLIIALLFESPLMIYLLHHLGLVSVQTLRANRKRVLLGMLILLAVLTPSQDVVTLLLAALPFWLLFEGSVFWLGLMEKRHA